MTKRCNNVSMYGRIYIGIILDYETGANLIIGYNSIDRGVLKSVLMEIRDINLDVVDWKSL